jgi:hypothetical protein
VLRLHERAAGVPGVASRGRMRFTPAFAHAAAQ